MQEAINKLTEQLGEIHKAEDQAKTDLNIAKSVFDGAQRKLVTVQVEKAGLENSINVLTEAMEGK